MKSKTNKRKPATHGSSKVSKLPKVEVDKNSSVHVKQIENGFLVSESGYTGKGKNQQWYNKEWFSPNNPIASMTKKISFNKKK